MSAPLVPSPLDYVGRRRFAFYPPIAHPSPNEWLLGRVRWSEVQVVNARHRPRALDSAPIYRRRCRERWSRSDRRSDQGSRFHARGRLARASKRVIEMPHAGAITCQQTAENRPGAGPAPVIGIRLEHASESLSTTGCSRCCASRTVVCVLAPLGCNGARL